MFNPTKLTPKQEQAWSDTRAALLWHAPAFSHIFYTLLQNNKQRGSNGQEYGAIFTDDPAIPVAGTDGTNLIFNTTDSGFFQFSLNQRVFVVVHEIMHCILNHAVLGYQFRLRGKVTYPDGSELPYIHELMNVAEDYVINAIITDSKIGQMPTDKAGKQFGCYDVNIATAVDSSLDIYKKIFKDTKINKVSFDVKLDPGATQGKNPQQTANERNKAQWDTEIASGMSAAKAMGKLSANLARIFTDILEPKVDWSEQIRAMFARKVGGGGYDWQRPDRRMITRDIYAPGRTGFAAGTVVVGVDTSGSIGPRELDMFMAEMAGILDDVKPEQIVIIWCDAAVNRVDYAEDTGDLMALRAKGAPGGGGTDFRPVFEKIDEEGLTIEALVYLTDGMGCFPDAAPNYPVIWGNILQGAKYPFGEVVDIPKQVA